jgi:hypothetical protein
LQYTLTATTEIALTVGNSAGRLNLYKLMENDCTPARMLPSSYMRSPPPRSVLPHGDNSYWLSAMLLEPDRIMSDSRTRFSLFNIPFGGLPSPSLAYPGYHTQIKRELERRFNGNELYSETRLQTAVARAAARQGLFALSLANQRRRFSYISNEEDRKWSLDRHWNDVRDSVGTFLSIISDFT